MHRGQLDTLPSKLYSHNIYFRFCGVSFFQRISMRPLHVCHKCHTIDDWLSPFGRSSICCSTAASTRQTIFRQCWTTSKRNRQRYVHRLISQSYYFEYTIHSYFVHYRTSIFMDSNSRTLIDLSSTDLQQGSRNRCYLLAILA